MPSETAVVMVVLHFFLSLVSMQPSCCARSTLQRGVRKPVQSSHAMRRDDQICELKRLLMLGAGRVIAIDTVPERMTMAKGAGAELLDYTKDDVYERVQDFTQGRGADACIDAVGTEPHTTGSFDSIIDRVKVATFMGHRPTPCTAPGNPLLPKFRHRLHRRRLRRFSR
jgi:hypothetical protein